jgi:peptidoglycan hydrolase-like protein with peptidoglycan-binding domain
MPHFDSQQPETWGWKRGASADIVPFSYAGHAFPQGVARGTDALWRAALDRICAQPGFALPADLGLGGGCWGYSNRMKASGKGWSFHAYGLALDVGAPWNPMSSTVPPAHLHRLPRNTGELVRPLGMVWGGSFGDWMHLEIHLSPAEVHGLAAELAGAQPPLFPPSPQRGGPPFPLPAGWYYGPRSGPQESVSNMHLPRPDWIDGLKRVQMELGIPADGRYGPQTAAAVRSWQAARGLQADGLVGRLTWGRMFPGA